MSWLDDERRRRVEKTQRASEAIKILKGLGWTSKNFADVAAGLDLEERSYPPLRKSKTKQGE
jgi:hypothetical protein